MNLRQSRPVFRTVTLFGGSILMFCAGCPGSFDGMVTGGSSVDGNIGPTASSVVEGEPNGSFSQAIEVVFDANGAARLEGTVSSPMDLDVFALGAIMAGDRIVISTNTTGSNLDVSIALFDGAGRLVSANDDAGTALDAFIDVTARHDGDPYFLVTTGSAFAAPGTQTGSYAVDITVERGGAVPGLKAQTLFLDFDGALVDIATVFAQPFELGPFDAGDIAGVYAGKTETLKQLIVETLRQNYERFNVNIITSDGGEPGPNVEFSTLFLGGFDSSTFGIAEDIDFYNTDFCDDAIIFTASFSPVVFSGTPTVSELAIAIGNVASHEAGHLLGLNHTDDDLDVMDDASPADAFIEDQEFKEAPLSADIMPIGSQDGVLLLSEIVGLTDGVTLKEAGLVMRQRSPMDVRHARTFYSAFRGGERVGLHDGSIRQLKARGSGLSPRR